MMKLEMKKGGRTVMLKMLVQMMKHRRATFIWLKNQWSQTSTILMIKILKWQTRFLLSNSRRFKARAKHEKKYSLDWKLRRLSSCPLVKSDLVMVKSWVIDNSTTSISKSQDYQTRENLWSSTRLHASTENLEPSQMELLGTDLKECSPRMISDRRKWSILISIRDNSNLVYTLVINNITSWIQLLICNEKLHNFLSGKFIL